MDNEQEVQPPTLEERAATLQEEEGPLTRGQAAARLNVTEDELPDGDYAEEAAEESDADATEPEDED